MIKIKEAPDETAFVTGKMSEETYLQKAEELGDILQMIRMG